MLVWMRRVIRCVLALMMELLLVEVAVKSVGVVFEGEEDNAR